MSAVTDFYELNINHKLDSILRVINNETTQYRSFNRLQIITLLTEKALNNIEEAIHSPLSVLFDELLFKLVKDNYLRTTKGDPPAGSKAYFNGQNLYQIDYYHITVEGMKFLADGGYTKQHERLLVSDNIKKTERFLLTFGTFFGGLWGGRELLSWLLNGKHVLYSISVFTAFYLLCTALIFLFIVYLLAKSVLEYYSRK